MDAANNAKFLYLAMDKHPQPRPAHSKPVVNARFARTALPD